tara:strand:- start:210 stop:458 length:249 start_codon:yes stop_codon:yes gene_type:complete
MKSGRGSLRPRRAHDDMDDWEDEEGDVPITSEDVIHQIKKAKKRAKFNATPAPPAPAVEHQLGALIGLLTRKLERDLHDEED